ncbi:MAG: spore coat protein [Halanaerobiales bacterium]|nr:spore coat protein [Halanaerobiales bacterium]
MDRRGRINVEMLKEIMQLNFAVLETVLYLNTHPTDQTVLDLHNDLAERLARREMEYQKLYGPLYPTYPEADYPWQWIDEPWPWEIEY